MTRETEIEDAIAHVVLVARLRIRELEVKGCNEQGEWHNKEFETEHAELAKALGAVEAAYPELKD